MRRVVRVCCTLNCAVFIARASTNIKTMRCTGTELKCVCVCIENMTREKDVRVHLQGHMFTDVCSHLLESTLTFCYIGTYILLAVI